MALTAKKQAFVAEYLIDMNAAAAAARAGYSAATARSQGARLLHEPAIAEAIAAGQLARQRRVELDQDWVLRRLMSVADGDIRRLFRGGELLLPEDLDDDTARAVASVEVVTVAKGEGAVEHVSKVKLGDKIRALELLGRHLKLFVDKVEVEHAGGITVVLNGDEAGL